MSVTARRVHGAQQSKPIHLVPVAPRATRKQKEARAKRAADRQFAQLLGAGRGEDIRRLNFLRSDALCERKGLLRRYTMPELEYALSERDPFSDNTYNALEKAIPFFVGYLAKIQEARKLLGRRTTPSLGRFIEVEHFSDTRTERAIVKIARAFRKYEDGLFALGGVQYVVPKPTTPDAERCIATLLAAPRYLALADVAQEALANG